MYSVNVGIDKKRGIIIYVVHSLVSTEINMLSDFSEYIFVQIKDSLQEINTVGALYRSPSSKLENDEKMINLINKANVIVRGKLILFRDFNFGNINWDNWTIKFSSNSSESKF